MQELNSEMVRLRQEMNLAIKLASQRGKELAEAEREYRVALAKDMLIKRDKKVPVTIINDLSRGDETVAELKFERDTLEVLYKSANEKILTTKLEIRVVENEMANIRRGV